MVEGRPHRRLELTTTILDAVNAATSDPHQRQALLFACGAESGCTSVQNRGGYPAYGPWQIALPYHPDVTIAQANDPGFAARFMVERMNVAACTAKQGALWLTDIATARLNAARCIEGAGPSEPYSAAQQSEGKRFADMATAGAGTHSTFDQCLIAANNDPAKVKACIIAQGNTGPSLPGVGDIVSAVVPGAAGLGQLAGAASGVATLAGRAFDAVSSPDFWVSVLLVLGGLFLAMSGTNNLVSRSSTARVASAAALA